MARDDILGHSLSEGKRPRTREKCDLQREEHGNRIADNKLEMEAGPDHLEWNWEPQVSEWERVVTRTVLQVDEDTGTWRVGCMGRAGRLLLVFSQWDGKPPDGTCPSLCLSPPGHQALCWPQSEHLAKSY